MKFDTLGTTFIPRIFEERDWVNLFGNFKDPIDELVKEFYLNVRYEEMLGTRKGIHHHPRLHCKGLLN